MHTCAAKPRIKWHKRILIYTVDCRRGRRICYMLILPVRYIPIDSKVTAVSRTGFLFCPARTGIRVRPPAQRPKKIHGVGNIDGSCNVLPPCVYLRDRQRCRWAISPAADVLSHPVTSKESVIGSQSAWYFHADPVPVHGVQHFSEIPVTHHRNRRYCSP